MARSKIERTVFGSDSSTLSSCVDSTDAGLGLSEDNRDSSLITTGLPERLSCGASATSSFLETVLEDEALDVADVDDDAEDLAFFNIPKSSFDVSSFTVVSSSVVSLSFSG